MKLLPPLPSWENLHPLLVHFPIALLIVAPLFLVLSMLLRRHRRSLCVTALLLMAIGTGGAYAAASSGEAAEHVAEEQFKSAPAAKEVLERHEEAAERVQLAFTILTVLFCLALLLPASLRERVAPPFRLAGRGLFLLAYLGACTLLAQAAHHGGLLVHTHDIHATFPTTGAE